MNGANFNGASKVVSAGVAQNIVFNPTEIRAKGVSKYIIETTGANNSLSSAVTRVRVKAGGVPFVDVAAAHLRAKIERLSRANVFPPDARLRFTIPIHIMDGKGAERYASLFPKGKDATVELALDANASAGTAICGWEYDDGVDPAFYSMFISSPGNVAASQSNARVPITQPGLVRGVSLPIVGATGLLRCRLVLSGIEVFNLDQANLLEWQFTENPESVTTTVYLKLEEPMPAAVGSSFFEVDTGAGAGVANEYGVDSVVPQ